jgi:hypothetical protein
MRIAWFTAAALPILFAAAGCARTDQASRLSTADAARVEAVLDLTAAQVRRCYRAPRVSSEGRQIVTRLRVRVTGDGQLAELPEVVAQEGLTASNRPYAGRMAEAAIGAVMRCTPLRLPAGITLSRAIAFDLTFSPLAPA